MPTWLLESELVLCRRRRRAGSLWEGLKGGNLPAHAGSGLSFARGSGVERGRAAVVGRTTRTAARSLATIRIDCSAHRNVATVSSQCCMAGDIVAIITVLLLAPPNADFSSQVSADPRNGT